MPMHSAEREKVDGAVAQSPILITTIILERLAKHGYESMLNVSPQLNESLYRRPAWTVLT